MKIYLVDFENVKSKGLEGIDKLTETDSVIIFFSENSDTLSFEMHQKVLSSKADIEYFKVSVGGKNALDFQLSTLLGFMVAKEIYTHIFVISNDKGFDFLHSFWGGKYIDTPKTFVYRTKTILSAINYEDNAEQAEQEKLEETVAEIELSLTPEAAEPEQPAMAQQTVEQAADEQLEQQEAKPAKKPRAKAEPSEKSKKKAAAKSENEFNLAFKNLVAKSKKPADHKKVRELFVNSETAADFHNALLKKYKENGTAIYNAIKPKFSDFKTRLAKLNGEEQTAEKEPDKLEQILGGICPKDDIESVRKCLDSTASKKDFYISMVKQFQMKRGCEYYNAVKSHYNELKA